MIRHMLFTHKNIGHCADFSSTHTAKKSFSTTPRSLGNLGERHAPTPMEKKILVWTKMFKQIEDIPEVVSFSTMRKARDLMRIRVNVGMAIMTVIGCIGVITYSRTIGSGDSLQKRGIAYQESMREKGRQEKAASESSA